MPLFVQQALPVLNDFQRLQIDSYNTIQSLIQEFINKANRDEELGKDKSGIQNWDTANDLMYLNTYLMIYIITKSNDIQMGNNYDYSYYNNIYKFDCIKRHFGCKGVNVIPLYSLYNINPNSSDDGIGWMYFEPDSLQNPQNIVD